MPEFQKIGRGLLFLVALILLGSGVILAFQDKTASASATYALAVTGAHDVLGPDYS